MRFFDAHCDTILKIVEDGMDFVTGAPAAADAEGSEQLTPRPMHITLPGLRAGGVGAQVFACWSLETRTPGRTPEFARSLIEGIHALCADHPDELVLADSRQALAAAFADVAAPVVPPAADGSAATQSTAAVAVPSAAAPPSAILISLEGADPLEGRPQALRDFYDSGVRLVTLAWHDNPFCGAVFGESGAGLSREGEELVELCEELGVLVDVSHATDKGFWDVCRLATRPFVASHSNCRAVSASRRNLTDEMIRALAERGGVMGINLEAGFLNEEFRVLEDEATAPFKEPVRTGEMTFDEAGAQSTRAIRALPRPPLAVVAAQVKHAIDVGGEDCVGLGGDLDGIDAMPLGIESVADYPRMAELLLAEGLTEEQVEKVCWRNQARVFLDVMK